MCSTNTFLLNFSLLLLKSCSAFQSRSFVKPPQHHKLFFDDTSLFDKFSFSAQPLKFQRPFTTVWNIRTTFCETKYDIDIDLSSFDIVQNPDQARDGDKMTIFYSSLLGLYPHIDGNGAFINGGIPQNGNLTQHLEKSREDIKAFLPNSSYDGLAVIDWESWHPLWDRMTWGPFKPYQAASISKVRAQFPHWKTEKAKEYAILEYEQAAKAFMQSTLQLGKEMRPKAKWGYYLFPDCYNYNGVNMSCTSHTLDLNNRIQWLFDDSTALYPSTYIGLPFKNSLKAADYTRNRILEALRVDSSRHSVLRAPVYAYNNLVYRKTREFLSKQDVISTSGLAAALGTAGVVLWADMMDVSKDSCLKLSAYVNETLGPYLKLASDAASECSLDICEGNGRCQILDSSAETGNYETMAVPYLLSEFLTESGVNTAGTTIFCQCYYGWYGTHCEKSFL